MGRKASSIFDYFDPVEPTAAGGNIRYECKSCHKVYASNATRLTEHLKVCGPMFQPVQKIPCLPPLSATAPTTKKNRVGLKPLTDVSTTDISSSSCPLTHEAKVSPFNQDKPSPKAIVERLAGLSTCYIADALEQLRYPGIIEGVSLIREYPNPLRVNICGPAMTVHIVPSVSNHPSKNIHFHFVDSAQEGRVIVIG
jgi:hypothetical protein